MTLKKAILDPRYGILRNRAEVQGGGQAMKWFAPPEVEGN